MQTYFYKILTKEGNNIKIICEELESEIINYLDNGWVIIKSNFSIIWGKDSRYIISQIMQKNDNI